MRIFLTSIFIFCFYFSARAQSPAPIDLILDIDWTTFYSIDGNDPSQKDANSLEVEGKLYRATDQLVPTIEYLLKNYPHLRISFFSGGEASRNHTLLNKVHLSDGRTLWNIAYKVFSKEHLTDLTQNPADSFSVRYKKEFSHWEPSWNPDRTLLIDDQTRFAVAPLKAVHSGGVFNYQNQFQLERSNSSYFAASYSEWALERGKAIIWLARLVESLNETTDLTFAEKAQRSWSQPSELVEYLNKGQRLLLLPETPNCRSIFTR